MLAAMFYAFGSAKGQAQNFVRMYIVNPLTEDNSFNVSNYHVGDVLTMEFYVGNVTDMISWQIHLAYNCTLIHYSKAWFPDTCVFKTMANESATPLAEVSNNVDNASDRADLLIIMTSSYSPDSSLQYPVSVETRGLLCNLNFTIVSHPVHTKIDFVMNGSQSASNIYVIPPYYLPAYETSVETLSGIYMAGGESAVVFETDSVPEFSALALLFLAITATLTLILAWIKRALLKRMP
jgi:hypothetical protein